MKDEAKLDAREQTGRHRRNVLEWQTYGADQLPDLKKIGHDLPSEDPAVQAQRFLMGPIIWPSEAFLASKNFRVPVERYFAEVNGLATKVLALVAQTLPYGPQVFSEFSSGYMVAHCVCSTIQLRSRRSKGVNNWMREHIRPLGLSHSSKTGNPGLEVLDAQNGIFVSIEPTSGAFVVNVGDMLSAWTGGDYQSSVIRVIYKGPSDRYSAAFFFGRNLDCSLDLLDGSKAPTENWTVKQHMIKRITDSYDGKV
ncbi:MAG: hypothetical protein Q9165_003804 [Trypethelium subeluteriae]